MEIVFYINPREKAKPEAKPSLLDRKASWEGKTADWGGIDEIGAPITNAEIAALKQSHGTKTVNITRAMRVKQLMLLGRTPLEIYSKLRVHGSGYGLSSIKHDHAALSPLLNKKK